MGERSLHKASFQAESGTAIIEYIALSASLVFLVTASLYATGLGVTNTMEEAEYEINLGNIDCTGPNNGINGNCPVITTTIDPGSGIFP